VPEWVRHALPRLPEVMNSTDRRASAAQRAAIDLGEAVLLAGREGEEFDAVVIDRYPDSDRRPPGGTIAMDEPPVRARCSGDLALGDRIRARLVRADPARRTVSFERATSA
jgi:exoribonuclease R